MGCRALIGAWLFSLCACPGKPPPDAGLPPPDVCPAIGDLTLLDEPELYLDQPATVHLAGRFKRCDGGREVSVDVQAALSDPSNQPVPVMLQVRSLDYTDADGGLAAAFGSLFGEGGTLVLADVTFQPRQVGLHHLVTRFEPLPGALQNELISMLDGRRAMKSAPESAACNWFEVWNGLQLCISSVSAVYYQQLDVSKDGTSLAQRQVFNVLPSGAGLWTVDSGGTLSLLAFDDGGMTVLATAPLPQILVGNPGQVIPQLAADQDQLLLFNGDTAFLARPAGDGGLELRAAGRLPISFTAGAALLLLAGEGFVVSATPMIDDGTTPQLCMLRFSDGGVDCPAGLLAAGIDDRTLWAMDTATGQLSALTLSPGPVLTRQAAPFRRALLPLPFGTEGLRDQSVFRFLSSGASPAGPLGTPWSISARQVLRVPVLDGGPALEGFGRWPRTPDQRFGASPGCVWLYLPETSQVLYLER